MSRRAADTLTSYGRCWNPSLGNDQVRFNEIFCIVGYEYVFSGSLHDNLPRCVFLRNHDTILGTRGSIADQASTETILAEPPTAITGLRIVHDCFFGKRSASCSRNEPTERSVAGVASKKKWSARGIPPKTQDRLSGRLFCSFRLHLWFLLPLSKSCHPTTVTGTHGRILTHIGISAYRQSL